MSVIEKMSIMGIRSFGPEDQNRQIIEFFRPLTLILGPNGTGKTTIIECLRYITTGETPPNSDRGGSFVHDPKFTTQREVKGQVKLQFKDVLAKKVQVTRSLQVTQTAKKQTLKTLEGNITRTNANGEKIHLSSKCAEIDAEMIGSLGVSKAILNSVIFCHQEESNWPLSEGKALKQRFDEIFAATRYIKALEELRKISNEKKTEVKVFEAEVNSLVSNKNKAEEFKKEMEQTESRLSACKDNVQEITDKLTPLVEKIIELRKKEDEIGKLQYTLETNNKMIKTYEEQEVGFRSSITNFYEGGKEELKEEMRNFDTVVSQKKKQLDKAQRDTKSLEKQVQQDSKTKQKLSEKLWSLKSDSEKHKDLMSSRDVKLRAVRKSLGMGDLGFDEDELLNDAQVQSVLKSLQKRREDSKSELDHCKQQFESKENSMTTNIQDKMMTKAQKQMTLHSSNDQIAKNKTTLSNIADELIRLENLLKKQDDLENDCKEAENELQSAEGSVDIDGLRFKLSDKQQNKTEIESKLKALNQEITQLHKEGKVRQEIEMVNKDVTSKQEETDKVVKQHEESLLHLLKEVPTHNFHDKLNNLVSTLNKKVMQSNKDLERQRKKLTTLETTKTHRVEELEKKKKKLTEQQDKIFEVCGSQDFESGYETLSGNIKELQDEKGAMTGSLYFFNNYIEKLEKPRPCCPLCTRSFENAEDSQALITKLQKKLQSVPSNLEEKEKLIAEKEKRLNSMLELKPVKENVLSLIEKEIPDLENQIEETTAKITELSSSINEAEEGLDLLRSDVTLASGLVAEMYHVDKNIREIEKHKKKISDLQNKIGGKDTSRTVDEATKEQSSLQTELTSVVSEVDALHEEINSHREQLQRLRENVNGLRAKQNEACRDIMKKSSLIEQQESIGIENTNLAETIKDLKTEISGFEEVLKELNEEKDEITKKKNEEVNKISDRIWSEEKEAEGIESLTKEIDVYAKKDLEQKIVDQEDKIKDLDNQIEEKQQKISSQNEQEKELTKDITSQEIKFRELEDNMKLIVIMEKITSLNTECQNLKEQIGGHNYRSLRTEKEQLVKTERDLNKEKDKALIHEATLKEAIKQCKRQLQDDMFKDAEKKHLHKCIELKTTKHAIEDLNKYYVALNKAIISYHQMKMNDINKIIADLWSKTYAGNDIDYIEIQSDEDNVSSLDKKRNYNYRVVMFKGDTATDMRGRCSAGQKVLASLIIRLALAETFCLNCGILALDEPTTNLDRDNISNLARALVEIVESRAEQRNFQLIIITHDEEFIDRLGKSDAADYYYKVSKDNNAFSKISKLYIGNMDR